MEVALEEEEVEMLAETLVWVTKREPESELGWKRIRKIVESWSRTGRVKSVETEGCHT